MTPTKAIFFDRDGTLIAELPDSDGFREARSVAEVRLLPGAVEAVALARQLGYQPIIVTNQPSVARGLVRLGDAEALMALVAAQVGNGVPVPWFLCPHDGNWCACRKPEPGLLYQAAIEHDLILGESVMIGDRPADMTAGARAGLRDYLLITPKGQNTTVLEAVQWLKDHD